MMMIDKWAVKLTANSCFVVNRIWWKLYPVEKDMLQQSNNLNNLNIKTQLFTRVANCNLIPSCIAFKFLRDELFM